MQSTVDSFNGHHINGGLYCLRISVNVAYLATTFDQNNSRFIKIPGLWDPVDTRSMPPVDDGTRTDF